MATQKQVQIIARVQFIGDPRKVVYLVRSSDGTSQYETSLFDGKATGCSCPSHCQCYHEKGCEALEQKRQQESRKTAQAAVKSEQAIAARFATVSAPAWLVAMVAKDLVRMPSLPVAKSLPVELRGREKQLKTTDLSTKGNFGSKPFSVLKTA